MSNDMSTDGEKKIRVTPENTTATMSDFTTCLRISPLVRMTAKMREANSIPKIYGIIGKRFLEGEIRKASSTVINRALTTDFRIQSVRFIKSCVQNVE